MFDKIKTFYGTSKPVPPLQCGPKERDRLYRRLRFQSFLAGTVGYSLYYVCRTTLNVVKKPIIDSHALDAQQLGIISSALLFAYAAGKFVNGLLADHSNIKRFMATGLTVSFIANLCVGLLGLFSGGGTLATTTLFVVFAVLWGINGWSQSMGAAPAIIALSRWYPLKKRGTYYGFFSASHNLGEAISFVFVGLVVGLAGWKWGFVGSAIAGAMGVAVILLFLHDTPESKGLPPVEVLSGEAGDETEVERESVGTAQKAAFRNPYIWILALASACMYVSRYAINGWGVIFLQEVKGFPLATATQVISVNAFLGIAGTVFSGWMSDKWFNGSRYSIAVTFGVLCSVSLGLFLYSGSGMFVNILAMVLFGIAIGVLICFVGGLMAVDLVPRRASGAALGIIGIASYVGAGIQDIISGALLDKHKTVVDGITTHDYSVASVFWIAASVLSFLLVGVVWRKAAKNNRQPN